MGVLGMGEGRKCYELSLSLSLSFSLSPSLSRSPVSLNSPVCTSCDKYTYSLSKEPEHTPHMLTQSYLCVLEYKPIVSQSQCTTDSIIHHHKPTMCMHTHTHTPIGDSSLKQV